MLRGLSKSLALCSLDFSSLVGWLVGCFSCLSCFVFPSNVSILAPHFLSEEISALASKSGKISRHLPLFLHLSWGTFRACCFTRCSSCLRTEQKCIQTTFERQLSNIQITCKALTQQRNKQHETAFEILVTNKQPAETHYKVITTNVKCLYKALNKLKRNSRHLLKTCEKPFRSL